MFSPLPGTSMPNPNASEATTPTTSPRHPHQEVIDTLAVGVLRLLSMHPLPNSGSIDKFDLGLCPPQSVTTNPDTENGVQP